MGTRHFATILLVALGLMVVGSALAAGPAVDTPQVNESTNESGGFGQQVSSFMQASAADADSSTERGMWREKVNSSENVNESVSERVRSLEQRLQRLQNRSERLEMKRANGTIPEVAYNAKASALRAQLQNVRTALNGTATVADNRGVNVSNLNELRKQAGNATGPEVSAAARTITDAPRGPPEDVPGNGPPANSSDRGPPDNRTAGPPGQQNPDDQNTATETVNPNNNGTTGPPDNRTEGPPDDRTKGPPDDRTKGPPENRTESAPVTPNPDRRPDNSTQDSTVSDDRLLPRRGSL